MLSVIIAEDDIFARAGLEKMIDWSALNMRVVAAASDGEEALSAYLLYKPQILLTDLKMPKLDGLALIRKIRQNDKEIQIIILTCYDDFALAKEAISLGVQDYILKLETSPEDIVGILSGCAARLGTRRVPAGSDREAEKEKVFNDFFYFESTEPAVFAKYVEEKQLFLQEENLCICRVIVADDEDWINSHQDSQGRQYRTLVTEVINEVLHKEKCGEAYCDLGRKYMMILCAGNRERTISAFQNRVLSIIGNKIYSYTGQNAEFHCSEFVQSYQQLRTQSHLIATRDAPSGGGVDKAFLGMCFIDENYRQNISLMNVAEYAGVSSNYMSHLLREKYSCSFTELVNRKRVAKAKKLLLETNMPIYKIARQVGFLSSTYFIRVFHAYCSQTPNSFRSGSAQDFDEGKRV